MPSRSKIAYRNRNHTGWWIYKEVAYWVSNRQKKLSETSRCPVWENTRLIRARNREEAYRKAMRLSQEGYPSKTDGGEWRFAGISDLLPVYEDLEDGAEILWNVRGRLPMSRIKKMVRSKKQLSVFDDSEEE